jgi:hypothetical protein
MAKALDEACDLIDQISGLEWMEEVDVNGEYVTTHWRPGAEMKAEVERILTEPSR